MPGDSRSSETLFEQAYRGSLPAGFKTTLADSERIRRLEKASPSSVLSETVDDWDGSKLTEMDVVENHVQRVLTSFLTPERTLELPGTGLELDAGHIQQFAARYKEDNDTPSGTVKDPLRANNEDIVFTFANPEVWDEISGTAQDNFLQPNLTAGNTLELVGQGGLDEGTNTAGNSLNLDDDEMLFFTGDFIDLSDGKSVITKTQYADLDGESDFGSVDSIFSGRLSGAHVMTTQGAWVQSSVDIDAKIYDDGDAEIVPVAFYMAPGTKAPALV